MYRLGVARSKEMENKFLNICKSGKPVDWRAKKNQNSYHYQYFFVGIPTFQAKLKKIKLINCSNLPIKNHSQLLFNCNFLLLVISVASA